MTARYEALARLVDDAVELRLRLLGASTRSLTGRWMWGTSGGDLTHGFPDEERWRRLSHRTVTKRLKESGLYPLMRECCLAESMARYAASRLEIAPHEVLMFVKLHEVRLGRPKGWLFGLVNEPRRIWTAALVVASVVATLVPEELFDALNIDYAIYRIGIFVLVLPSVAFAAWIWWQDRTARAREPQGLQALSLVLAYLEILSMGSSGATPAEDRPSPVVSARNDAP